MPHDFWSGKRVFLTGHTGFKGGWLALWLLQRGAKVHGFALEPPTEPNLFGMLDLASKVTSHVIGDIRDQAVLTDAMQRCDPEIVLHLAAQPIVLRSYDDPIETYQTNVMGTVHLLEAGRGCENLRSVVNVTTDKCYENREWVWPYRENEPMGGHDPYSNSKACSELVTSAYRDSFYRDANIGLASARAGNVIGGGDWAENRLIPDFLRCVERDDPIVLRSPMAIRPWQHVLEPLAGYLLLAEQLFQHPDRFSQAYNFGPTDADARPVKWIVDRLCKTIGKGRWTIDDNPQYHEANTLKLDSSKANKELYWSPKWDLRQALDQTVRWHSAWHAGEDLVAVTEQQIRQYEATVRSDD